MRRALSASVLLGTLLLVGGAYAEQSSVTERETNTTFQVNKSFGGVPHVLVGVGAREATAFKVNVYGAGLYLGRDQAIKAWQGYLTDRFAKAGLVTNGQPDLAKIGTSAEGRHFVVYGNMPRAIEMAFVRDVSAEQISEAYNESWDRVRLDRAAAGDALTQFMAAVNHPMSNGQRMTITTRGNTINVTMPTGNTTIQGNRALLVGIWKIWFGDPPLQRQLRDGMMSMLTNLHQLVGAAGN